MELVTVGWILEYLVVHLVELGLVAVLDEVGDRFTNILNLLIRYASPKGVSVMKLTV